MRNSHFSSGFESLENRRLFSSATLDIDSSVSTITAAGTVNTVPLVAANANSLTADIGGTVDVSTTKRGIKFQGSDITLTPEDGTGTGFSFQVTAGPTVDVNALNFDLTSNRLKTTGGKFSVANVTLDTTGGSVAVTGLGSNVDLSGSTVTIDYAVGRVKTSNGKIRITMPFSFSVTGNYTLGGVAQALDLTFTGSISARGEFATGASFVAAKSTQVEKHKKDSVSAGVLG